MPQGQDLSFRLLQWLISKSEIVFALCPCPKWRMVKELNQTSWNLEFACFRGVGLQTKWPWTGFFIGKMWQIKDKWKMKWLLEGRVLNECNHLLTEYILNPQWITYLILPSVLSSYNVPFETRIRPSLFSTLDCSVAYLRNGWWFVVVPHATYRALC